MSIRKVILLSYLVFIGLIVNAQPDPGGDPGSAGGGVPVDGGLALLLAAGAGYGAKKAYDYRKNKVKSDK
jgi:hypothetical protein